jgi:threonine aldolase
MQRIDLRSDTVTRPDAAMRAAMATAEVGDDVYGEDPSVNRLEQRVAALLGKPCALFVPSGTMANQIAIALHTRRGDEVIIGEGAHCQLFESGAAAAISGVQFAVAGAGGLFDGSDVDAQVKSPAAYYLPRSALVAIENTHNRAGGRVFPQPQVERIRDRARHHGLALHLDGARLWNAAVASARPLDELAAPFDSVSVCFSKGLGAPVGSALAGSQELVARARRLRRMLGGAMRQAGVLAAAALYALEHNFPRLADDHGHAKLLGERLEQANGARVEARSIETNIVNVELALADADVVIRAAAEQGLLLGTIAPRVLRLVTHLDLTEADVRRAGDLICQLIERHSRQAERPV